MSAAHPDSARPPLAGWMVGLCLAIVYIVWGTTYYALKVGVAGGAGPYFLVGSRFFAAGVLLMAWLMLRRQRLPTLRQWGGASLLGLLLLVLGVGSVTVAEQWVSSGAAVALVSFMPLGTALWAGLLQQWPGRREWLAITVGTIGTLVMVMGEDLRASPAGTALILGGTLAWSFGTVLSRRLDTPPGAMGFAAEMLAGGVIALLVSAVLGETWELPDEPSVWWAWLYLLVFGSLIAFSAYRLLVERASPTLASTYAYVNPPVALLVGWWLGDESFSANVLLGLPIVLAAVAWLAWPQLRGSSVAAAQPVTTTATSPQSRSERPRPAEGGALRRQTEQP